MLARMFSLTSWRNLFKALYHVRSINRLVQQTETQRVQIEQLQSELEAQAEVLKSLTQQVSGCDASGSNAFEQLQALQPRIDQCELKLSDLQPRMDQCESRVRDLEPRVDDCERREQDLQPRVDQCEIQMTVWGEQMLNRDQLQPLLEQHQAEQVPQTQALIAKQIHYQVQSLQQRIDQKEFDQRNKEAGCERAISANNSSLETEAIEKTGNAVSDEVVTPSNDKTSGKARKQRKTGEPSKDETKAQVQKEELAMVED